MWPHENSSISENVNWMRKKRYTSLKFSSFLYSVSCVSVCWSLDGNRSPYFGLQNLHFFFVFNNSSGTKTRICINFSPALWQCVVCALPMQNRIWFFLHNVVPWLDTNIIFLYILQMKFVHRKFIQHIETFFEVTICSIITQKRVTHNVCKWLRIHNGKQIIWFFGIFQWILLNEQSCVHICVIWSWRWYLSGRAVLPYATNELHLVSPFDVLFVIILLSLRFSNINIKMIANRILMIFLLVFL